MRPGALFGRTIHSRVKREFREEITNLAAHWLNVNRVGRCPHADVGYGETESEPGRDRAAGNVAKGDSVN